MANTSVSSGKLNDAVLRAANCLAHDVSKHPAEILNTDVETVILDISFLFKYFSKQPRAVTGVL